jgi:hypothetical protein
MKRPAGLILSAIVLAFLSLTMLIVGGLIGFTAFTMKTHLQPLAPIFLPYAFAGMAFFFVFLAVWAISTVIGLVMLRTWARYSILLLGGGMAVLGTISCFGSLIIALVGLPGMPSPPPGVAGPPMRLIFAGVAVFYGVMAAIGIWWLIYFNRRAVREIFLRRNPETGHLLPPIPGRRPTAITIFGCLFLFSAAVCAAFACTRIPAFLLGFILPGVLARFVYGGFALIALVIGIGLLRLHPAARLAAIAISILGVINTLLGLLPWYQRQFAVYSSQFRTILSLPASDPTGAVHYPLALIAFYGAINVALNAAFIWLLIRYRTAFTAPPPLLLQGETEELS